MTPAQEDLALKSCHPLYAEWCREDEDGYDEYDEDEEEYEYDDDDDYEEDYEEEYEEE